MHGSPPNLWTYACKKETTRWPRSSCYCCWYCCHQFDNIPIFIPIDWNPSKDVFYLAGNFCSWNCAKTYLVLSRRSPKPSSLSWLGVMCKKICYPHKHFPGIQLSPPKECLRMFGGNTDIKDFRDDLVIIPTYESIYVKDTARIAKVYDHVIKKQIVEMHVHGPKTNKRSKHKQKDITSFT